MTQGRPGRLQLFYKKEAVRGQAGEGSVPGKFYRVLLCYVLKNLEFISEGDKEPPKNVKGGVSDSPTYQLRGSGKAISPL